VLAFAEFSFDFFDVAMVFSFVLFRIVFWQKSFAACREAAANFLSDD
jgi:hypothetical protein